MTKKVTDKKRSEELPTSIEFKKTTSTTSLLSNNSDTAEASTQSTEQFKPNEPAKTASDHSDETITTAPLSSHSESTTSLRAKESELKEFDKALAAVNEHDETESVSEEPVNEATPLIQKTPRIKDDRYEDLESASRSIEELSLKQQDTNEESEQTSILQKLGKNVRSTADKIEDTLSTKLAEQSEATSYKKPDDSSNATEKADHFRNERRKMNNRLYKSELTATFATAIASAFIKEGHPLIYTGIAIVGSAAWGEVTRNSKALAELGTHHEDAVKKAVNEKKGSHDNEEMEIEPVPDLDKIKNKADTLYDNSYFPGVAGVYLSSNGNTTASLGLVAIAAAMQERAYTWKHKIEKERIEKTHSKLDKKQDQEQGRTP